jgi:hypothetical protein
MAQRLRVARTTGPAITLPEIDPGSDQRRSRPFSPTAFIHVRPIRCMRRHRAKSGRHAHAPPKPNEKHTRRTGRCSPPTADSQPQLHHDLPCSDVSGRTLHEDPGAVNATRQMLFAGGQKPRKRGGVFSLSSCSLSLEQDRASSQFVPRAGAGRTNVQRVLIGVGGFSSRSCCCSSKLRLS